MGATRYAPAGAVSVLLLLLALGLSACGGAEDETPSGGVAVSAGRGVEEAAPKEFAAGEAGVPEDWVAQGSFDRKIV